MMEGYLMGNGIFKYFKVKKEDRLMAQQPKDKKTWIKHIFSEIIGTFYLAFALAGLSIFIPWNNGFKIFEHAFLLSPVILAFVAGFIIVGLALFIFARWSVDLNPSVTLYRWLNGTNTSLYAFVKIIMQIIGAILAGLLIYIIGHFTTKNGVDNFFVYSNQGHDANAYISAIASAKKDWLEFNDQNTSTALASGALWIFFGEMIITAILLFSVFSPRFEGKYRDLMIFFIISLAVLLGLLIGSAALNPARGFSQQLPALFFGLKGKENLDLAQKDLLIATFAMLIGDLVAPFFYALVQGFSDKYVVNFINAVINFKNNKSKNMTTIKEIKEKENK
ncbi:MIP family channel proteins [Mycoplasmopsis maculosa]|uniref:MIP family channel proteins n=1 Tax=Mycoplasmopsis maculosa TaxID=114885 RepID=A0A449B3N7_9BACT|nr:aquaporin [Mycoplasmopsis maculosa]VEU75207.1 MIP family channel proteins [Mycoplasmopsis maculosa]